MGDVYLFDSRCTDFSTTGLCGALVPTSCIHEELAGGMSSITMEHPFDDMGRWKHLKTGNILKCLCRVRTTPEILDGQIVTSVEKWIVKDTATQQQRGVFGKEKKGKRKATLKPGTEVIVTQKGAERYKIKSGKTVGWIAFDALDYQVQETIPESAGGIEEVAPPWVVRYQLFRIQDVDTDTKSGTITVTAPHISYDLITNNVRFTYDYPLTAVQALNGCSADCTENHEHVVGGIMGSCDVQHEFEAYTDIGDTRTSIDCKNINPIEALLNPDTGFLARWDAELIRDDYELYFLKHAGRNRGTRIEYAKNLLGVTMQVSDANVATAILPIGEKKDGTSLYLTGDESPMAGRTPQSQDGELPIAQIVEIVELGGEDDETVTGKVYGNLVISDHADEYPELRVHVLKCTDCTVEKGKKGVTIEIARARMLKQAKALFEEQHLDLPEVTLTVNFVQLGDTVEFAQYKDLDPVYLYDEIVVTDKVHGIEALTDVHRIKWDCLNERMQEIELGNVRTGVSGIYSWQVQSLNGGKIEVGTLSADALEDATIPEDKLDEDLQNALSWALSELERALGDIESARTLLIGTREWLEAVDAQQEPILQAVTDGEGAISALQLSASDIRAGLLDAEGNITALQATATSLQSALSDAQDNISTLIQTATGLTSSVQGIQGDISDLESNLQTQISTISQTASGISSTVANIQSSITSLQATDNSLQGQISNISQTASSISSTVSTLNSQVQSLIQQTANMVAVKLKDDSISSAFEMRVCMKQIGNDFHPNYSYDTYGLEFFLNNVSYGMLGVVSGYSNQDTSLKLYGTNVSLSSDAGPGCSIRIGEHEQSGEYGMICRCDIIPYMGAAYDIGGAGDGRRWRRIYTNNTVNVSDIRAKHDIDTLDAVELLRRLRPVRYRLNEDNEDKLRYGFIAQEVISALDALGHENAALVDDENKDHLGLVYQEVIAPLVEGWQAHEKKIQELEARLAKLERTE